MKTNECPSSLDEQLAQARCELARLETESAALAEVERLIAREGPPGLPTVLLEQISDAFYAFNADLTLLWVNAAGATLAGISPDDIQGRNFSECFSFSDCFTPSVGLTLFRSVLVSLDTGDSSQCEIRCQETGRWHSYRIHPTSRNGAVVLFCRDITEEKRAKAKIAQLSDVVRRVHNSVIVTDLGGTITDWNQGAERIFGYTAEEAIGLHVSALYFEEDRSSVKERVLDPLLEQGWLELEMRNQRKDGQECFIELSLSLVTDINGQVAGMLGVASDITSKHQAHLALLESEQRFRCVANAMPQIVYIADELGRTVFINDAWTRYSGVEWHECSELRWSNWLHPDDLPGVVRLWERSIEQSCPFESEYRLRSKDGSYRWHLSRSLPVMNGDGQVKQWIGTLTDIQDQKLLELNSKAHRERVHSALQAARGVLYEYEPIGRRLQIFGNLEALLGTGLEEQAFTEESWLERVLPEDRDLARFSVRKGETSDSVRSARYRMRHADGHWVTICDRHLVVHGERSEVVVVTGCLYDATAQERADLQVERAMLRLSAANAELTHFVHSVSHDLQAPLRTLNLYSQLLNRKISPQLDADEAEYLSSIVDGAKRMSEMLQDLRTYSSIVTTGDKAARVSLSKSLQAAIADLCSEISAAGASILADVLPDVPVSGSQFDHVFQNLIGNAIKYRRPGVAPQIRITAEQGDGFWLICVRDNGQGFEPRWSEEIFSVFRRLQTYETPGTGMGLAICKRIVERHGGRIWATSQPGEGAAFFFTIPI